jgi:hypothetical protein
VIEEVLRADCCRPERCAFAVSLCNDVEAMDGLETRISNFHLTYKLIQDALETAASVQAGTYHEVDQNRNYDHERAVQNQLEVQTTPGLRTGLLHSIKIISSGNWNIVDLVNSKVPCLAPSVIAA